MLNPSIKCLVTVILLYWINDSYAQSDLQVVNIGDFKTVKGDTIKDCKVGYRTLGKINKAKNNVVLWPTWFGGKSEDIMNRVASRMTDTTSLYFIIVDAFGNGISSSPSNSPGFPNISVRDMVNSQYVLLSNYLGINHVKVIMGISMGGMQAMEWLVSYPDYMDKAISIVGTPKQSSYDLMLWKTEAALIATSEQNESSKESAMRMVSNVHLLNISTPTYWFLKLNPEKIDSLMLAEQFDNLKSMKADDWLCQLNAMIDHDIYKSSGKSIDAMKELIKAKTLIIVSRSDHMVNPGPSIELSKIIGSTLVQLDNDCGHLGTFCDQAIVKAEVTRFIRK